jgi:hypothetical protein
VVDPSTPPAQDPVLAEQIAESLVARAQELLDARIWLDAKQLAVEAIVKSPKGTAADRAKLVIKQVNQVLGITDVPKLDTTTPPDLTPIEDPTRHPVETPIVTPPAEGTTRTPFTAATVHGALYGGLLGAAIGSFIDGSSEAAGAVPVGIALGVVGALAAPAIAKRAHADEAQVRTVGAGSTWGGVVGAMFAGTIQGANGGIVSGSGVLVGGALGSTLGALGGAGFAANHKFTTGDVALVDTMAGIGTFGGLTIGMLMQPAQREAYSLNAALGTVGGVIVGIVAAPLTNTTPRRMVRVAGLSALGGALPFLLYAGIHSKTSTADERVTGALSSAGLVGGAWLGFYLTRDMDVGLDVPEGKPEKDPDDAPPAVVGRSSAGGWRLGAPAVSPLSRDLAPQHGMAVSLLSGAF